MKKLNRLGMYLLGFLHGYIRSVLFSVRLWWWKLTNGFPSKGMIEANPGLQKSLAETIFEDVCGRSMEAEIIVVNVLSKLHVIIEPNEKYAHGSIAVVGSAIFNPHHPDYNSSDVKYVVSPDVPLRDRIIKLIKMIDDYNNWRPGVMYRKLQFFANRPGYEELLTYFQRHGLPRNIDWLDTNMGERK